MCVCVTLSIGRGLFHHTWSGRGGRGEALLVPGELSMKVWKANDIDMSRSCSGRPDGGQERMTCSPVTPQVICALCARVAAPGLGVRMSGMQSRLRR